MAIAVEREVGMRIIHHAVALRNHRGGEVMRETERVPRFVRR